MPAPVTIVLASGNAGKIRELAALLRPLNVTVVPQSDYGVTEADETGQTFAENALLKARHAHAATGLPAIADDSGLSVAALDGRPGVRSARYAGEQASDDENIDKLLAELNGVADRRAAFHCAACFVAGDDDQPLTGQGVWHGEILTARRGTGGFGYDPVFFDAAFGLSSAELTAEQKNARSHRGQALRQLAEALALRYPG
tara:strand:- start:12947 stop:13549 length:603 start_codon:yes stop_codon:yes gene_type:complete